MRIERIAFRKRKAICILKKKKNSTLFLFLLKGNFLCTTYKKKRNTDQ